MPLELKTGVASYSVHFRRRVSLFAHISIILFFCKLPDSSHVLLSVSPASNLFSASGAHESQFSDISANSGVPKGSPRRLDEGWFLRQ